jgi:hypothetical protein
MNKKLSEAQDMVLKDIRRMIQSRGVCYSAELQHLDGRTLQSLERRGLIRYRGFRVELVTV